MKLRSKPLGDYNIIGHRVAEIRIRKGITQKDFIARLQAEGLDINPTSYSKIEGQTREVNDIELSIIAKALGIQSSDLFEETD